MPPPMLVATRLHKRFTNVVAVDGVSFRVDRGEILGFLGPNGAGKTTTMRIVLNILLADGGEITYDGHGFSAATRDMIGYLPEERGLYRKSKLLDTILYFACLRGMDRARARGEAHRWLERFGVLDDRNRKVEELSKGNQQKVQIITAIIHNPALVILDEPFSGLDPINQMLLKDILLDLKKQGKAVIFSTHQMEQAEKLSDTICLIDRGKVVLDGALRDVKRRHGRNSLHVEFEGDGTFMEGLPGVCRSIMYKNSAELELTPGTRVQDLVAEINGRVELRKIELLEPSLQSIFMQMVDVPGRHPGKPPEAVPQAEGAGG